MLRLSRRRRFYRPSDSEWMPNQRAARPQRSALTALIVSVAVVSWAIGLGKTVELGLPLVGSVPPERLQPLPAGSHRYPTRSAMPRADSSVLVIAPQPRSASGVVASPALEIRVAPAQPALEQQRAAPPGVGAPVTVAADQTQVPQSGYVDSQAQAPAGLPLMGPFVKWGQITSRLSLFCGFQDPHYPGHTGVDLLVDPGAEVLTTLAGQVVWAAENGAYGNLVVVENGGWQVWLAHLSRIDVKSGDRVTLGQTVGASGGQPGAPGAGSTGGPHLHYGIRYSIGPAQARGAWVDPTVRMPMEQVTYTGCVR